MNNEYEYLYEQNAAREGVNNEKFCLQQFTGSVDSNPRTLKSNQRVATQNTVITFFKVDNNIL